MEKVRDCIVALLLVVGVYLQESGFLRSHMPAGVPSQTNSVQTASARGIGSVPDKATAAERGIQERQGASNAVESGAAASSVTTSAVSQAKAHSDLPSTARSLIYPNHSRIEAEGEVAVILSYDPADSRYQKFMVRLKTGKLLLISHDTASAPRIEKLKLGDRIAFCGEYSQSLNGEEVSWTHKDRDGQHEAGWLKHNGKTYQ